MGVLANSLMLGISVALIRAGGSCTRRASGFEGDEWRTRMSAGRVLILLVRKRSGLRTRSVGRRSEQLGRIEVRLPTPIRVENH